MDDNTTIIPANPGFWFHWVPSTKDESKFVCYSHPIIGWRIKKGLDAEPVMLDESSISKAGNRCDDAIEYPNGSCINDSGTLHNTLHDWLEESEAGFNEMRDEYEALQKRSR